MPADTIAPADPTAEDLIRRYFAAFNAGDIEGMLACLADDLVHDVNQGGRRHGKSAFSDFCRHMARCYAEELRGITVMTEPEGRHAAAEFTVHGRYIATDQGLPEASGQTYVLTAGTFFEIEDGRISRITTCYNLEDWNAQVSGAHSPSDG